LSEAERATRSGRAAAGLKDVKGRADGVACALASFARRATGRTLEAVRKAAIVQGNNRAAEIRCNRRDSKKLKDGFDG